MSTTPDKPTIPAGEPGSPKPTGPDGGGPPKSSSGPPGATSPSSPNRWLWPVVALVVGIGIGLLVMGLLRPSGGATSVATPTVTSTPAATSTAAPSGGTATAIATGTVPAECLEVADDSQNLVNIANQAVQAARDLNADALSDLVRQLGEAQHTLTTHADTCRAARATVTTAPPLSPSSSTSTTSPGTP